MPMMYLYLSTDATRATKIIAHEMSSEIRDWDGSAKVLPLRSPPWLMVTEP